MKFLKTAWNHIHRSPYQAFAAIFIMTQTFFVVSFFTFIIFGSSRIISYFESIPQVTAFFKEEVKQEAIDELQKKVNATGKIAKMEFVSKQDAFKIYKEQNKDDPLLLEIVTADILPPALKISTQNIDDLPAISDTLSKSPTVDRVVFQKDVVSNLTKWTDGIRRIGLALIIILSLDSIFVMVIIIGVKISQKKEEIEIMRLLGATNWYVRLPFVYEGIVYGCIGAIMGWTLATGLLYVASPTLSVFLKGIPLLPIPFLTLLALLGGEILISIILGFLSSFIAVWRYLK